MTPYMRTWVLQGLAPLIAEMGGDVDRYEKRFRLPLKAAADQNDLKVPAASLVRLMEACAEDLDCPDFGIRTGFRLGRAPLGPIMLAMMQCASVAEAIEACAGFMNMLNPALELQYQLLPTGPRLTYQLKLPRIGLARQFEEWCIAINIKILQILAGPQARPRFVFFSHPALLPNAFYTDAFGCAARFSQAGFGADYLASDGARPMSGNNPELKALVTDYLERIAEASGLDLEHQMDALIRQLLPTGRCSLNMIAGHYHVSVRTMQRRLDEKGLIFEKLVDDIRRERAASYLDDPALRMSQVAGLLGYVEQSSFSHAFKRWYRMSPSAWRHRAR
jgi:AraC-like DNA-binding protein